MIWPFFGYFESCGIKHGSFLELRDQKCLIIWYLETVKYMRVLAWLDLASSISLVLQLDIYPCSSLFEVYKVRNNKNTLKRKENYSVESRLVLAM